MWYQFAYREKRKEKHGVQIPFTLNCWENWAIQTHYIHTVWEWVYIFLCEGINTFQSNVDNISRQAVISAWYTQRGWCSEEMKRKKKSNSNKEIKLILWKWKRMWLRSMLAMVMLRTYIDVHKTYKKMKSKW